MRKKLQSLVGVLALTSAVACAQDEERDLGHETQTISSEILGTGYYTGPDLEMEFEDNDEVPLRMAQQQVTFSPAPVSTPFSTPDGLDATPWHEHPGYVLIQVLEGQFTLETEVRCEVYNEGEVFVEYPHELNRVVNTNDGQSKTHATHLGPSDEPRGTPHTPPANGGACGFGNQ